MKKKSFKSIKEWYNNPEDNDNKNSSWNDYISWMNRRIFESNSNIRAETSKKEEKAFFKNATKGLYTHSMIQRIKSLTEFEKGITEIHGPSLIDSYLVIEIFVKHLIRRFHPNNKLPIEDVSWDCFTQLYQNGLFACYDESLANIWTWVAFGVKNFLIDLERKYNRHKKYFINSELIIDLLDNDKDPFTNTNRKKLLFLLEEIRPENIGEIKFRSRKKSYSDKRTIEVNLSEYIVLHLFLAGLNFKMISQLFDVSHRYIGILFKKGANLLKSHANKFNLEFDDLHEYLYEDDVAELISVIRKLQL
ncbi:MAG: hypothetical protein JW894_12210 [Bacteroidales bacterium]|nr:hypothetical protein [Bacteroidales bacterium]